MREGVVMTFCASNSLASLLVPLRLEVFHRAALSVTVLSSDFFGFKPQWFLLDNQPSLCYELIPALYNLCRRSPPPKGSWDL